MTFFFLFCFLLEFSLLNPFFDDDGGSRITPDACPNKFGDCNVFPPLDEWNRPIDSDPVDYRSDCYVERQMTGHNVHLDLGSTEENFGIPYVFTSSFSPEATIGFGCGGVCDYSSESDKGPVHIPFDAPIEGGTKEDPNPQSGDRHLIAVNLQTCEVFEMFATVRSSNGFCCCSSARWDLKQTNNRRPDGWTSSDAAGMPIFPALLKYEETQDGNSIKHALRFTLPSAPKSYVYPGNHYGPNENADYPPYGTRFRLKSTFDTSSYSGASLEIVKAMKRYGMYFTDQGSSMFVQGMSHVGWADAIEEINSVYQISGSDFEAVQSPYEINYGWEVGTVECNGKTSNTDPDWKPVDRDVSLCTDLALSTYIVHLSVFCVLYFFVV